MGIKEVREYIEGLVPEHIKGKGVVSMDVLKKFLDLLELDTLEKPEEPRPRICYCYKCCKERDSKCLKLQLEPAVQEYCECPNANYYTSTENIKCCACHRARKPIKPNTCKEWVPKNNDKYWFISNDGCLEDMYYHDTVADINRVKYGNYFRTKPEAKKMRDKIRAFVKECGQGDRQ